MRRLGSRETERTADAPLRRGVSRYGTVAGSRNQTLTRADRAGEQDQNVRSFQLSTAVPASADVSTWDALDAPDLTQADVDRHALREKQREYAEAERSRGGTFEHWNRPYRTQLRKDVRRLSRLVVHASRRTSPVRPALVRLSRPAARTPSARRVGSTRRARSPGRPSGDDPPSSPPQVVARREARS